MIITLGDALKELMQNIEKNYKKTLDFENKVSYNKGVLKKQKGLKMDIIYNKDKNGWQIVHLPNEFIKASAWNQPINDKVFASYDEAVHYLDKCSE